jgi:proteic killer suppression protein
MIKSFKHKGLKLFYETGSVKGIQAKHASRLKIILQFLDSAVRPEDLNFPGMRWHPLKGELQNFYSVTVSANWRIIYKFEGQHVILVDYLDYH